MATFYNSDDDYDWQTPADEEYDEEMVRQHQAALLNEADMLYAYDHRFDQIVES